MSNWLRWTLWRSQRRRDRRRASLSNHVYWAYLHLRDFQNVPRAELDVLIQEAIQMREDARSAFDHGVFPQTHCRKEPCNVEPPNICNPRD